MGGRVGAVIILLLLLSSSALGVGIGVNKGKLSFTDVLQNGYAEEIVLVTTDSEQPIYGTYQIEGEIAPWLRIEPANDSFIFSRDDPHELKVILEPPADAQIRGYSGAVRVLTGEVARQGDGRVGTSTRAAFLIRIQLGMTGTQILSCSLGGIRIQDTEIDQPSDFRISVKNTGNVRLQPEFQVLISDQYQTKLIRNITVEAPDEILPTATEEFLQQLRHDLDIGQYWANVRSPDCSGSTVLTFDVLERGGVSDKGELLSLSMSPWAKTGDIVPINAVFRNIGGRVVSAKFKGTITNRGGSTIYKVIDTDFYNVLPGQTANIETFFNPTEPGQYIVAGRVLYNNKLTFQKSAVLNVEGPLLKLTRSWNSLIVIVIIILLLLLLIARRRRRRRYHRRL